MEDGRYMLSPRLRTILIAAFTGIAVFGFMKTGFLVEPASAKPAFMDRYNRDPYAKAELRGKCILCHVGRGGGERNDFGDAFEDAGYRITPKLRDKFPQFFEKDSSASKSKAQPQTTPEQ
jgi:hypothetical protein